MGSVKGEPPKAFTDRVNADVARHAGKGRHGRGDPMMDDPYHIRQRTRYHLQRIGEYDFAPEWIRAFEREQG